jgi:hypothetical protein
MYCIYMRILWGIFISSVITNKYIMKVQEIINEEWSLDPRKWGSDPALADTAKQTKANAAALTAAQRAAASVKGASPEVQKALASIAKGANETAVAASREALSAKVGNWTHFLTVMGAMAITAQLYYNFDQLEKKYNAGELNKAQYKEAHAAYFGLWVIQFMVPWLISKLGIARLLTFFVRVIVGILTLGSVAITGGATFWAAIVGITIEQAIFTGIQTFMMTPTFEKWVAQHFFKPLVVIGTIPDESWNILRGYLSDIPGINKLIKNPGDDFYTSQAKNKKEVNPAAAARDEEDEKGSFGGPMKAPNGIMINGVRVTNEKGQLDDYAMMRPFVTSYMKLHPEDPDVQKVIALQKKPK